MTELLEVKGCLNMLMAGGDAKYHSRPSLFSATQLEKLIPSEQAQAQETLVVKIRDK